MAMNYRKYIVINPSVRFGKPCVKGTRITVYDILGWFASGMNIEEILHEFPQLNREQIRACLAFSADKERSVTVVS